MPSQSANEPAVPLHGRGLLGHSQLASASLGPTGFRAVNPATGQSLAPAFYNATATDIDRAMALAEAAFDEYRSCRPETIAAFLDAIASEIEQLGDALIERAHAETGLPIARLTGERARTAGQARLFAQMVRDGTWMDLSVDPALPDRKPAPRPDLRRRLVPIGPVVVFGASNFPLAISVAGCDTLAAFAVGCPVVVKAHPSHPGTSELVGQAIARAARAAQLPEGVFSLLHGASNQTGLQLVCHPLAQAVAFTGSTRGGRALFDAAADRPRPIPVYAEMGSTNPVFVLPEALARRGPEIAARFVDSVALGVGQFCTRPGLLVTIGGSGFDAFVSTVADRLAAVPAAPMLSDKIYRAFHAATGALSQLAGVKVLAKSNSPAPAEGSWAKALVLSTDAGTFIATPALADEVFGPSALIVKCESMDEMAQVATAIGGHLAASIHSTIADRAQGQRLLTTLERYAGRIVFDGFPTGVEVCAAMHHGGPYPATTHSYFNSIGTTAILRFVRPVCYQDCPEDVLSRALLKDNPHRP